MQALTLRHKSVQNHKYVAFNDDQFLHYHFYQTARSRRNTSSSPLQNSPPSRHQWATGPLLYRHFTITLRHTTPGGTSLDGWSDRRRCLYMKTQDTHERQNSMPPAGSEPTIPASGLPHTHVLLRLRGHCDRHPQ